MQQQQSERGASQEEKRPTKREKAMNQGTGGPGAQELSSSTQGWGFLRRCSGKDKRGKDHLGNRFERSGMQVWTERKAKVFRDHRGRRTGPRQSHTGRGC